MILAPQQSERHALMDAGRGFGILGILWLNIFIFALPYEAMVIPGIWGEHTNSNIAIWNFVSICISGVMRGIISMLFGAAALLIIQRCEATKNGFVELDKFFRRLLLLILFGVIHSYILLWPHDILYVYGVIGLLIFPFRNFSVRRLSIIGGIMLAASVFFTAHNSNEIQEAQTAVEEKLTDKELEELRKQEPIVEEFEESSTIPQKNLDLQWANFVHLASQTSPPAKITPDDSTDIEKQFNEMVERIGIEIESRQQGYISNFFSMASMSFDEQTDEMLTNHLLDIATFFIFGIVLLKTGFLTLQLNTKIYFNTAIFGYTMGLTLGLITSLEFSQGDLLEPVSFAISDYTYDVRRAILAVANLALLALAIRFHVVNLVVNSLKACGRMALSLYVSQTIICNSLFLGFGLYGQLEHYEIAMIAVAMTLLQMIVASFYFRLWSQGPLEWLLRKMIGNPQAYG